MTADALDRHVHTFAMPIRWGDMDAMGHVNNAAYFRYLESARIAWFDSLGFFPDPRGTGPVVVNASCTFIRPLLYPGDIELRTFAGKPGRSSFETRAEIRRAGEDAVYAEGRAKVVWVDHAAGKSMPLPDAMRRLIEDE
jgi:acyl-CoA thioester hydrolase